MGLFRINVRHKYSFKCLCFRGIFCVADPSFEVNHSITFQYIDYDKEFIVNKMTAAEEFWKNHIFPMLFNSIESKA